MLVITRRKGEKVYRVQEGEHPEVIEIAGVRKPLGGHPEVRVGLTAQKDVQFYRPEYLSAEVMEALRSGNPVSSDLLKLIADNRIAYGLKGGSSE